MCVMDLDRSSIFWKQWRGANKFSYLTSDLTIIFASDE